MYNPKSLKAEEFISDEEIRETLAYADANKENVELIDQILAKAKECKGLTHREASVLLACPIPEKIQDMYDLAAEIKKEFYVGAFPYAEVKSGLTSFFLGARSVCPSVSFQLLRKRLCVLSVS